MVVVKNSKDVVCVINKNNSNNETLNQLIDTCPNEKIFYLEELVKIYIKSVK